MSKSLQKMSAEQNKIRIAAEVESSRGPDRCDRYRRQLRTGASENTFNVIASAKDDRYADWAIREYIAEVIDQGREHVLNSQLRAYAIMYLVHRRED